jgi:hypothetical protein
MKQSFLTYASKASKHTIYFSNKFLPGIFQLTSATTSSSIAPVNLLANRKYEAQNFIAMQTRYHKYILEDKLYTYEMKILACA